MSIISSFLDQATFKNLFYFKLSSGYFHKYPTFVHKAKIKQKLKTHHMWQLCAVMTSWVQWWVQCYQINTWKNGNNGNFEKDFTFFSASKTKCSESFSKKTNSTTDELNSSLRHIIVTIVDWKEDINYGFPWLQRSVSHI